MKTTPLQIQMATPDSGRGDLRYVASASTSAMSDRTAPNQKLIPPRANVPSYPSGRIGQKNAFNVTAKANTATTTRFLAMASGYI
jgi:hypothetical protein